LTNQPDIILPPELDKRGHKPRERRCVARNEVRDPQVMIRFVMGPENIVFPDVLGKLPGRGVWVSAARDDLKTAIEKGGFKRGFKGNVTVPDDLNVQVEAGLRRHTLSLIGMAKKSGKLFIGFDQVMVAARTDALGWRIEASDGAEGARGKIRALAQLLAAKPLRIAPSRMDGSRNHSAYRPNVWPALFHAYQRVGPMPNTKLSNAPIEPASGAELPS